MNVFLIIITIIIVYLYFFNKKSRKSKEEIKKKNEEVKRYTNFNEEELYKIDRLKLKEIAGELAKLRNDYNQFSDRAIKESVFYSYTTRDNMMSSLDKLSIDYYEPFKEYEGTINRLNLEFKAESINQETYNNRIQKAKSVLLRKSWDISVTEYEIAIKLKELNLISDKELKVVEVREENERILNEKSEKLNDIQKKKFYVDYILNK